MPIRLRSGSPPCRSLYLVTMLKAACLPALVALLTATSLVHAHPCHPPARWFSLASETPLQTAIRQLAETFGYRLVTDPALMAGRHVPPLDDCRDLEGWAARLLKDTPLTYTLVGGDTLIVFRRPERPPVADPASEAPEPVYESEMLVMGQQGAWEQTPLPTRHYSHTPDLVVEREAMARMGITDLASALELASGVKMEQDRYMIIRGMKGRYQSVRLNGAVIPGLGPSHQSLPMDFFPVGVVSQVNLHKSVYADSPGGATAGLVNIETLRIPERDFLSLTAGLGYREDTTGQPVVTSADEGMNAQGFRDGRRDLPTPLADSVNAGGLESLGPSERETAGEAVPSRWGLYRGTADADHWLNLSAGRAWEHGDVSWGVTGALGLNSRWHNQALEAQRFQRVEDEEGSSLYPAQASEHQRLERQADQNLLLAAGLSFSDTQHLGANLVWLHQGTDYAELIHTTELDAREEETGWQQRRTLFHWTEQELRMQQFYGLHYMGDRGAPAFQWQVSSSETRFQRPYDVNYRYTRRGEASSYRLGLGFDQVGVAWRSMEEETLNLSGQWVVPLRSRQWDGELKAGCERYATERHGHNLEFSFEAIGDSGEGRALLEQPNPSDIFTPERIVGNRGAPGFILVDRAASEARDETLAGRLYRAERDNQACFLLADVNLGNHWHWVPGLRAEQNTVNARLWERQPGPARELQRERRYLPSLSVGYSLTARQQLRASYSRTLVWPGVNELLPIDHEEIDTRVTVRGNPALAASDAENLDVQWAYKQPQRLNLKALLYYKQIDDAIEGVFADSSEPGFLFNSYTFTNADASSYGYELEADYEWTLAGGHGFMVSGSYARIYSDVEADGSDTRPLQGQPDYIAGLGVRYERQDPESALSLLFKRSGRELYIVSDTPGLPPVYQQPENELSVAYHHRLLEHVQLTLAVDDALENKRHYTQGDATYLHANGGRTWRLSLTLEF